ncbi:MAG: L,D-transpeptidase family protein [Hyphomicrobiales bacterium]
MKIRSVVFGILISSTSLCVAPQLALAEGRDDDNSKWERKQERTQKRERVKSSSQEQRRTRRAARRSSPSFFEQIFGNTRSRRSARRTDPRFRQGGQAPRGVIKTGALPTFNAYQPDPKVAVSKSGLKGDVSGGRIPHAIFAELSTPKEPVLRVLREEREAIIAFYKERKFEPAWVNAGEGLSEPGKRVLDVLSKADGEGLDAKAYLPTSMVDFDEDIASRKDDPDALARLDVELTVKALTFARHAYSGHIKPKRLSSTLDVTPEAIAPDKILAALMKTGHPEEFLDELHPKHPVYVQMRDELKRISGTGTKTVSLPKVPDGPSIRFGQTDDRVPLLRQHLEHLGYLKPAQDGSIVEPESDGSEQVVDLDGVNTAPRKAVSDNNSTLYTQDLADAVMDFQSAKDLSADGIVGRRTLAAMNGKVPKNRVAMLRANMERMRWLPKNLGQKHIFVNQAAFQVRVIENGEVIHKTRVIVGKQRHPTPLFSDEMETVVFNPYWNVPRSITRNEFMPKIWDDPSYLDRNGYEVVSSSGQVVSPYEVDWWNYSGNIPYRIRQTPGYNNALGEVKFLFPNKHSVYLHDTPTKHLFKKQSRAFSHGCVRVQNPRKFAEFILNWDEQEVSSAIAGGQNHSVRLTTKLPVHLTYFTVWPDDQGKLSYRSDFYGRDKAVLGALKRFRVASN